jgi:hypothetical protein
MTGWGRGASVAECAEIAETRNPLQSRYVREASEPRSQKLRLRLNRDRRAERRPGRRRLGTGGPAPGWPACGSAGLIRTLLARGFSNQKLDRGSPICWNSWQPSPAVMSGPDSDDGRPSADSEAGCPAGNTNSRMRRRSERCECATAESSQTPSIRISMFWIVAAGLAASRSLS